MMKILAALGTLMLMSGTAVAGPATIYIMRHLQRDAGADPSLSAIGQANAKRLAEWFVHDRPVAIFVTPYKRTRETVAPLAAKLGITPADYDPRQPERLIEAVRAQKGPVLIVGHSNTVPAIVHALGGPEAPELSESDYARIWIVRDGTVRIVNLDTPQPR